MSASDQLVLETIQQACSTAEYDVLTLTWTSFSGTLTAAAIYVTDVGSQVLLAIDGSLEVEQWEGVTYTTVADIGVRDEAALTSPLMGLDGSPLYTEVRFLLVPRSWAVEHLSPCDPENGPELDAVFTSSDGETVLPLSAALSEFVIDPLNYEDFQSAAEHEEAALAPEVEAVVVVADEAGDEAVAPLPKRTVPRARRTAHASKPDAVTSKPGAAVSAPVAEAEGVAGRPSRGRARASPSKPASPVPKATTVSLAADLAAMRAEVAALRQMLPGQSATPPIAPAARTAPVTRAAPAMASSAALPQGLPVIPGVEASIVRDAIAAGIAPQDVSKIAGILGRHHNLATPLLQPPPRAASNLAQGGPVTGAEGRDKADVPVEDRELTTRELLIRFTTAMEALATRQTPSSSSTASPTERALDAVSLPNMQADSLGSGTAARRTAHAHDVLRRAVSEDPEHFSRLFFANVAKAFRTQTNQHSTRDYLEYRSRLNSHKPTQNWLWMIAGALDALKADRPQECMARLSLAMIVGEQVSLDQGSWQLAWQYTFEDEPPHANFTRGGSDSRQLPVPVTADSRWTEVAISRLRDLDSLLEIRRRLAKASLPLTPLSADTDSPAYPKAPKVPRRKPQKESSAARPEAKPPAK